MLKVIDSAIPVECWSCAVAHNESTLFCPHCSKIQPPPGGDYFSVFSLVPKLDLDLGMLEHQFHKLSRKLHPDRFARASVHEKDWSLADTALLNDAYRTLRDPIRRTEYLLKLRGAEIGEEHAGKDRKDPSRVPADLLEEAFDLNMQLEEMRMSKKMGDTDPDLQSGLEQARKKYNDMLDQVDSDLRAQWQVWDNGDEPARKEAEKKMVSLLDRRRYINNLVRDVTETLGS
ncbi:Fe-S protein assembly co-chaperone HscB [Occallatibacter savannae]|uniref:Fe-S protein assembly co-chaperone HscB n=1 Tax=Occallatibacter savannae TaxID=1002691 RepID=UPI000D68CB5A|nr:Fe-S protein assembly co-chaperone HscB [Occallatibacter savannae]